MRPFGEGSTCMLHTLKWNIISV